MRAARATLSSTLKLRLGATRRLSTRASRERRWPAIPSSASTVAARYASVPITLTKTLVWRRSRVTSTPVTVIRPTRRFCPSVTGIAR